MSVVRYTASGLDNVLIEGLPVETDDAGETVFRIPHIRALHRVIAHGIVTARGGMSGRELRFLRTELGMTQAELARFVHVDTQTVGRWERGETPIQPAAETLIRRLVAERLGLDLDMGIEELAERSLPRAELRVIRVTTEDGGRNYRLAA